jgi:hypothetical protein
VDGPWGPRGGGLLQLRSRNHGRGPTDCHDLSIRKTRFPSTVGSDLCARVATALPDAKGAGFERCRGDTCCSCQETLDSPPEGERGGKTRGETQIRCVAPQEGSISVYGTSPLKCPSLSDTSPTRSEVASSA